MISNVVKYPDGTEKLTRTLETFKTLKRRQLKIYLMQNDKRFNSERADSLIDDLLNMNILFETKGKNLALKKNEERNNATIAAFWVLLQFMNEHTEFDLARYPSEIVFKNEDDIVSEIVVCEDDFLTKLDYLSKRKKRESLAQYYILLLSNTIEEIDDDLFPDVPFTIITISAGNGDVPKLMYHEIYTGETKTQPPVQNNIEYESEEYDEGYETGH